MILTIGMPSYRNPAEVWATITALKMYQDLSDVEVLVVDNFGDLQVKEIVKNARFRYEKFTDEKGTSPAKNKVFELANGYFVLCIDSHILLWKDAVRELKDWIKANDERARNLIQGPMMYASGKKFASEWNDTWRSGMWGVWGATETIPPKDEKEVGIFATALLGCRKDSWLGFPEKARGFGGQPGVIHKKYEKAGRKTIILPFLIWAHNFHRQCGIYPTVSGGVIRNYLLGFKEIGLDPEPIYQHFGKTRVEEIENGLSE